VTAQFFLRMAGRYFLCSPAGHPFFRRATLKHMSFVNFVCHRISMIAQDAAIMHVLSHGGV
jgi:hypothetical protein